MNKQNIAVSSRKPLAQRNLSNIPNQKSQLKKQNQHKKSDQIQQQGKQLKQMSNQKQIKPHNPSKIPIKQKPQKKNLSDSTPRTQNQKSLKEMVQIQIFTDPTNIELTRKKQKQCEEQIKQQIEKTRKEISINSYKENEIQNVLKHTNELNDFSDSIEENEKINNFNRQFFSNMPPICEDPFIADLSPGSLFEKSTVKTPTPGFSIRKNYNLCKIIPTFPSDQNTNLADTRLDSASEVIYPDGRKIIYNSNNLNGM